MSNSNQMSLFVEIRVWMLALTTRYLPLSRSLAGVYRRHRTVVYTVYRGWFVVKEICVFALTARLLLLFIGRIGKL